jgi:hypothetical protein
MGSASSISKPRGAGEATLSVQCADEDRDNRDERGNLRADQPRKALIDLLEPSRHVLPQVVNLLPHAVNLLPHVVNLLPKVAKIDTKVTDHRPDVRNHRRLVVHPFFQRRDPVF